MPDTSGLYRGLDQAGRNIARARELKAERDFRYYDTDQERALRYFQLEQAKQQAEREMEMRITIENARLREESANRDQRERAARMDYELGAARLDPRRADPMPSQNVPGTYFSPMTGQVLQPQQPAAGPTNPAAATTVKDEDGKVIGHKTVVNGKETFIKPPSQNPLAGLLGGQAPGGTPAPAQPKAVQTPAPSGGGGPPTVKTKEERDALPPGTIYVGPDGKRYRKK